MSSNQILIDGDYSSATSVGPRRYQYPFRGNGDRVTALFQEDFWQTDATYTPAELGVKHPTLTDFYLIAESDREPLQISDLVKFTRTYSRVPVQQSVPGSLYVTKPDVPGTFPQIFGEVLIDKPVETVSSYDLYLPQAVTGDSGAAGSVATGGTYTLTFASSTTASINYNDSNSTVQTRLNALTPVSNRGNVTVTGSFTTGFEVAFASYSALTADISGLTTTGTIAKRIVTSNGGYVQAVNLEQAASSPTVTVDATNIATSFTGFGAGTGATGTAQVNYAASGKTLIQISPTYGGTLTGGTYTLTINGSTTAAIAYNASSSAVQTAVTNALGSYTVSSYSATSTAITFYLAGTTGTITAGNYTLTIFSETTANIAYNASISTIQTRLNALTSVTNRGGCVVTGTGLASDSLSISFTVAFTNAAITGTSSLTPTGSTVSSTLNDTSGRTQTITLGINSTTRDLVIPSHNISAGQTLFISDGTNYYTGITNFSVPDSNTIRLVVAATDDFASVSSITSAGRRTATGYTPGISLTRCKRVTDFYLPGITPGISSVDDIPLPTFQGSPTGLLTAIFAGSTSINYEVGDLSRWRDGPIFARTITTINASQL